MSQKLRGFVGQSMRGQRPPTQAYAASYPGGSFNWTAPYSGYYRFSQWGCGGTGTGGGAGGASGGHAQTVVFVSRGQTVALVVGRALSGVDTTVTFPSGRVVTTTGAVGTTPGAATNGDLNLAGSSGGNALGTDGSSGLGTNPGSGGAGDGLAKGGGAGAPGYGGLRGGNGGLATGAPKTGGSPGGGGADGSGGGDGLVVINRQFNATV